MFGDIWPAGVPSSVRLQNLFNTGLGVGVVWWGWPEALLALGCIPGLARIPAGFSASISSAKWRSQYVCLSASSSHPVLPPPLSSLFQFLKIKMKGDSVRLYFLVLVISSQM